MTRPLLAFYMRRPYHALWFNRLIEENKFRSSCFFLLLIMRPDFITITFSSKKLDVLSSLTIRYKVFTLTQTTGRYFLWRSSRCVVTKLYNVIQGYSEWLSEYNCPAAIMHQIRETTAIWQFHSKVVCTVSKDRMRVYPGTEGTNQNRHWNHHRWHAERTRLSCWCL